MKGLVYLSRFALQVGLLASVGPLSGWAQTFLPLANDWLVEGQPYRRMAFLGEGVYRVSAAEAQLSSPNVANLRLYHRGTEQPIHVEDVNGNNVFDGTDFLEFVGERQDGTDDAALYRDKDTHAFLNENAGNPALSIFSDSTVVFLTVSTSSRPSAFSYQVVRTADQSNLLSLPVGQSCRFTRVYTPIDLATGSGPQADTATLTYTTGDGGQNSLDVNLNPGYVPGEGLYSRSTAGTFGTTLGSLPQVATPNAASNGRLTVEALVKPVSSSANLTVELRGAGCTAVSTRIGREGGLVSLSCPGVNLGSVADLTLERTSGSGNMRWGYLQVAYDRQFVFTALTAAQFRWTNPTNTAHRWDVVGLQRADSEPVYVYDRANRLRIEGQNIGSTTRFFLPRPNQGGETGFALATEANLNGTGRISVQAINPLYEATAAGATYVIITPRAYLPSAQRLQTYRDTCTVNPVGSTRIILAEDIYNTFGYGTPTPLAIQRFCLAASRLWTTPPEYVMLWGKAVHARSERYPDRLPTFGSPASDAFYATDYRTDALDLAPAFAIGRVNVFENSQGEDYIRKLNEYEHTPYQFWMKNAVHLGGGFTPGEQALIESALADVMQPIFEGAPLGGQVFYSQKRGNTTLDPTVAENVRVELNRGVSLVQFFAHSTADILEVELNQPSEYNNVGRYPFIIANGCLTGNFVANRPFFSPTFGEQWINSPDRGAIGYLATSSLGFPNQLRTYSTTFYSIAFRDTLGIRLGDAKSAVLDSLRSAIEQPTASSRSQYMAHNLQGDPAVRLYTPSAADYEITAGDITPVPDPLVAQLDSFQLALRVRNIGRVVEQPYTTEITQTVIASGASRTYTFPNLPPVFNEDTLTVTLRPAGLSFPGLNEFRVRVNAGDSVPELNYLNNEARVTESVPSNVAFPLLPQDYAIVPTNRPELVAGTYTVAIEPRQFEFQLDTVPTFTSGFLRSSGVLSGPSVETRWDPQLTLVDSQVYYWRVRLTDTEDQLWSDASFIYLGEGQNGWNQSSTRQLEGTTRDSVELSPSGEWSFAPFLRTFQAQIGDFPTGGYQFNFSVNGTAGLNGNEEEIRGLIFSHIDGKTLQTTTYFPFYGAIEKVDNASSLAGITNTINSVPAGDYIFLAYTGSLNGNAPQAVRPSNWPASFREALASLGVSPVIGEIADDNDFLLLGRKGAPAGSAELLLANNRGTYKTLQTALTARNASGRVASPRIGPAASWGRMEWAWAPLETADGDQVALRLEALDLAGNATTISSAVPPTGRDLSNINPAERPFLQAAAALQDAAFRTAPQLAYWRVFYEAVPEAVLAPATLFTLSNTNAPEGELITGQIALRNITAIAMDSLDWQVSVRTEDGREVVIFAGKDAPLPGFGRDTFSFTVPTRGLVGANSLRIGFNLDLQQPEQYRLNNRFTTPFTVRADDRPPLLDVTIDGRRILNGELVSPSPEILIEVNDENPYFPLTDPRLVELAFNRADAALPTPIPEGDPRVVFTPGDSADNEARLKFTPGPLEDGLYRLTVNSRDEAGNRSGQEAYAIEFEVVNRSTVSYVVNYPNPFSTSTRFAYTLTGGQLPDIFRLHVYTISGRHIKTIDFVELGEVRIGRHITSYAWDGTDEFGDRLANGVYLYRTEIKMPGDANLEQRDEAEQYFQKGWGKMLLMR